jgi:hypothetical protein
MALGTYTNLYLLLGSLGTNDDESGDDDDDVMMMMVVMCMMCMMMVMMVISKDNIRLSVNCEWVTHFINTILLCNSNLLRWWFEALKLLYDVVYRFIRFLVLKSAIRFYSFKVLVAMMMCMMMMMMMCMMMCMMCMTCMMCMMMMCMAGIGAINKNDSDILLERYTNKGLIKRENIIMKGSEQKVKNSFIDFTLPLSQIQNIICFYQTVQKLC